MIGYNSLPEKAEGFTKRPSAAFPSFLVVAAYVKYASLLCDSGALHLSIFEQP
jgi:hypothetical protein